MATSVSEHIRARVLNGTAAVGLSSLDGDAPPLRQLSAAPPKPKAPRRSAAGAGAEAPAGDQDAAAAASSGAGPCTTCLDPPGRIRANLFIGSRETEAALAALRDAGITHVLQAGGELTPSHEGELEYLHLSLGDEDDEDIVACFKQAFAFIDAGRKKGAVLVHCAQGMSRSGAIAVGYLMWRERLSLETALAHVQQARPVVDPNEGFNLQLREFERIDCDVDKWKGWDKQQLERCFRRHHVSGRRVVHGFSDVIRRFHVHNLTDDDVVFADSTVLL